MKFDKAYIDRAIVVTQYDLRGFVHPLGYRCPGVSPKNLSALTWNLAAFAANPSDDAPEEYHEGWVQLDCTYEEYLDMCQQFANACDSMQREAIQLILKGIFERYLEIKELVATGSEWNQAHFDGYLGELATTSHWGKWMLALENAFMGPSLSEMRRALYMLSELEVRIMFESAATPSARRAAMIDVLARHDIEDVQGHLHAHGINDHVSLA